MASVVIMPKQGLMMTEGTITSWLKKEGEEVVAGTPLFEMETDKLTITMDAEVSGTLLKIIHPEGDVVPITEAIKISTEKTKGYKLQMWLADFVYVLIFGAAVLVLGLLSAIPVLGVLFVLVLVVLYIAFVALAPLFAGLVQAAFYEEIAGTQAKFCAECGQRLTEGAAFCPKCGKSVE